MFQCRVGYRHENGDLEGFSCAGISAEQAEHQVMQLIYNRCLLRNVPFSPNQVIHLLNGLSTFECSTLFNDWAIDEHEEYAGWIGDVE